MIPAERYGRCPAWGARFLIVAAWATAMMWGCAHRPLPPNTRSHTDRRDLAMAREAVQSYLDALDRRDAAGAFGLLHSARRASLTPAHIVREFAAPRFTTHSFCVSAVRIAADRVLIQYQVDLALRTRPTARGAVRFVAESRRETSGVWRVWEIDLDAAGVEMPLVFPDRAAWNRAHLRPLTRFSESERKARPPSSRNAGKPQ